MTTEETAELMVGIRQAMEEILLPELRQIRTELSAMRALLDNFGADISQWVAPLDKRCDRIERQVAVYQDVQRLKEQMANLRMMQKPSA